MKIIEIDFISRYYDNLQAGHFNINKILIIIVWNNYCPVFCYDNKLHKEMQYKTSLKKSLI